MPPAALGIALSLTACAMNATGLNLQRLASQEKRRWCQACSGKILTAVGIFLSSACGLVDLVSYNFAPQSVLAPFGAATLVINLMIAPVLHGQKLKSVDLVATTTVIIGVVLTVTAASAEDKTYTPEDLYSFATDTAFLKFSSISVTIFIILSVYILQATKNGNLKTSYTQFAYPVVAGMLGGATVLSAKIFSEVSRSLSFHSVPHLWALSLGCAVLNGAAQIYVNNRGLAKHSPLIHVPIFTGTFVISNALAGGIYFKDFASFSPQSTMLYASGSALVVGGVLSLVCCAPEASQKNSHVKQE